MKKCFSTNGLNLIYRGRKSDLPQFLEGFKIPVPRAWFDVLFNEYQEKKISVYKADAYSVTTGCIIYGCEEAYEDGRWLEALKKLNWAVQVEWAQTPTAATDRPNAIMEVSILEPNAARTALERKQMVKTTQKGFLALLQNGDLTDLSA